jgi:hypothetical protein
MGRLNTLKCLLFAASVILVMLGYHYRTQENTPTTYTDVALSKPCVIGGIFYSADKPSAMIGGTIVHEGDVLQGVRVVKIYSDRIELEKNGNKWSQKVLEKPNGYWSKKD